jgi:5'-nucleotidase
VVNSFLAAGGDNFTAFTQSTGKADSGRIDLQSLVDYIGSNSPVAPDLSQRSVGVQLSAPASGGAYLTGEAVTLNLSSLLFSRGAPTTGTATVSLGGTELDSEAVTFTLAAEPFDEQGTASLAFTIPSGVTGAQTLTVTGPGGTEVGIPITIAAPVDTRTLAWPDRFLLKRGNGTDITVQVRAADKSAPVGVVTILDRGIVIGTATLTAEDAGRIEIPTGALARGLHVLTVNFAGDGVYEDSHTRTVVVAH